MQRTCTSRLLRRGVQFRPFSSNPNPIAFRRANQIPKHQHLQYSQTLEKICKQIRPFTVSLPARKGLSPDSEDPKPKEAEPHVVDAAPVELSNEEYNQLSDDYMDSIVNKLEELQEEREDVDVEYSAGVLTLTFPPIGTYVINKQPPNKQIWLSSPITGPKRYDYVIVGEGQDSKEGTGVGNWVYLRDMSTLADLLLSELGVDISDPYSPLPPLGE